MALFKKDSEKTAVNLTKNGDLSWVLIGPRITEKAAMILGNNVFTFNVAIRANKIQIKKAIVAKYNVNPLKVNIIAQKPRKVIKRGKKAHQSGTKKAMVFLKKGDTIEFV